MTKENSAPLGTADLLAWPLFGVAVCGCAVLFLDPGSYSTASP